MKIQNDLEIQIADSFLFCNFVVIWNQNHKMSETEITKDKSNVFNLIAIGAFSWYLLKSLSALFFHSFESIGIISGIDPVLLFWTNQILCIALISVLLRIWITKIWKQIDLDLIQTKKLLIKIGIAIFLVAVLQFLLGFYITDYLISNFKNAWIKYKNTIAIIDRFNLIDISFNSVGSLILLLLFIKWK
jgi:hypothetical protein